MTYTIEDVKRLVPEAKEPWSNGLEVHITIGHKTHGSDSDWGKALLTTRRQLEIARLELNAIATQDDIEMVLDPTWAKRIAEHALDAINKEGERDETIGAF